MNWRTTFEPTWLPDGKRFIWPSERDGWNHLYLYNLDGTLIRRLTTGQWPVFDVTAVDPNEEWVYFTGHAEPRLYDTHLYRVKLDGTGFKRLTEATGEHLVMLSPSRRFFLDRHSSPARPDTTELRAADGRRILVLEGTDIRQLADLKWTPPEDLMVKAADGKTDLRAVVYKPYDFDPSRRYPVVDYIYNGPHFRWIQGIFFGNRHMEAQTLAQAGFITVMIDGRGTIERGKAFQDVAYKSFGTHEIQDHVAAVKELARSRPYMDLRRVGLVGSQWPGSYMAMRGMVTAPEFYCAGIARLIAVGDPVDMFSWQIEPYLGMPQDDPAVYQAASVLPLAGKLQGRLLIFGETDEVQGSFAAIMKTVTAFKRAKKHVDFDLVAERPADYRDYYNRAYRRYFEEHLLRDGSCSHIRAGS
jgi:dipeptidyl aminopeptidase/acylaminoacyl peptidase